MDEADRQFQSWTHWDLPAFGDVNPALTAETNCKAGGHCMLNFVRPYAQAVDGEPVTMRFDRKGNNFVLSYKPDLAVTAPTEIFVPPYRYPNGYTVQLEPADAKFTAKACPSDQGRPWKNKLCVTAPAGTGGQALPAVMTVTVTPKGGKSPSGP